MLELLLAPKAKLDLQSIYLYTESKWGANQADKYQDILHFEMLKIRQFPNVGKEYSFHTKTYRYIHIKRHVIFYRYDAKNCFVIRILHDQMMIDDHELNWFFE